MRRVAVVGPGALGMLLAAALAPVAEVTLVGRRPAWAAAVRESGIVCDGWPAMADGRPAQVRAVTDPGAAGPADLVIVVVKSDQTAGALPAAQALLASGAKAVLSLQNGLSHLRLLTEGIGWDRLVLGTCTYGVTRLGETSCRLAGQGEIVLGARPAAPAWPQAQDLLARAGLRVSNAPDTLSAVWQKALINAGINPLTALLGVVNGEVARRAPLRAVAAAAVQEGAAVAQAHGVTLPGDPVAAMLAVAEATAANRSSMLQDIAAGRGTEIDAICGELVRLGAAAGVPTPVNEALLALVASRAGVS